MAVVTITKDNFEAEVLGCKIPVVLDFWAEWCEPCKMQSTVIEELAAELDGKVKFGKVNVDEEASLALNYQIMSIPTLVVMHYGLFQGKAIGVQGKDAIREMLQGVLYNTLTNFYLSVTVNLADSRIFFYQIKCYKSNYFSQIGMKSRQKIESDGLNRGKTVLKG